MFRFWIRSAFISPGPFFSLLFLSAPIFSKNFASRSSRSDDSHLGRPTARRFFRSVGLDRSEALRSPKGGAFRAKRRAKPTTAGSPTPARLSAVLPDEPLRATDDWPAVPTCVAPPEPGHACARFRPGAWEECRTVPELSPNELKATGKSETEAKAVER